MNGKMRVVQCWDDGVTQDARLAEILRKHGAKATFNLNAAFHQAQRANGKLGWDEMRGVYAGFTIANHSLTHPSLPAIAPEAARREITEGRARLQDFFGQPVLGFAYPFGTYNEAVMELVRAAGHVYARTVVNVEQPFPPADPMAFHPCCHFLANDFWARYEKARAGGVFYFWGHSYELVDDNMWSAFDDLIARISADTAARWADVADLFTRAER